MSYKDQIVKLRTEVQTLTNQAKATYADLEAKGADAPQEERNALNTLIEDGTKKRQELERLEQLQASDDYVNAPRPAKADPRISGEHRQRKSWGQIVLESEQFKAAARGSTVQEPRMDRVNVKAVYGSSDGAGGYLVQVQREPEVIDIPQRETTILNLINVAQTNSDAVEYASLASRTNNAAPVAEFTGGTFGLKPESDLTFTLATANVRTIATWVAASRRILQDAPRLQNTIDTELTQMLQITLENEVLSGSGSGEHFTGILNASGILTRTQGSGSRSAAGDTVADTIRRAITDVRLQFYIPNGIVMNPADVEAVELSKDTTNAYIEVFDSATGQMWRTPVVESAAITAKTALVGDLKMGATLWDRMQTEIRVGEPNDFFVRNAVAVLAELRAAFAVTRPLAIEKVTLT
ncbi:MAG TPA: phage major capsid protein [Roseiflexaceae bacterium]|nr:phage major capsid protein [Roseiflexaceae bacterium]